MNDLKINPTVTLTKAQKREMIARQLKKQIQQPSSSFLQPEMPEMQPGLETLNQMEGLAGTQSQPQPQQRIDVPADIPVLDSLEMSVPPATELAAYAAQADMLWKDIGGSRSLAGKLWEMFADNKKYPGSSRDYFVSTYLKHKLDPHSFRKAFPSESNIFEQLEAHFDESFAPSPDPNASPIPSIPGLPPRPALKGDPSVL